jgi:hypothetical protein
VERTLLSAALAFIVVLASVSNPFEDPTAVHEQWSPILNEFCAQKGVTVEPIYGN